MRRKAVDVERLVARAWAAGSARVAAGAQALLRKAMEAPAASPEPPAPTLLPTMKGVAFWNAAAAATVHGDASTLELRAARAVDAAVEWALAPVFYCCVLADSLSLPAWPATEELSAAVVSLMLDLLVAATWLASRLGEVARRRSPPRTDGATATIRARGE